MTRERWPSVVQSQDLDLGQSCTMNGYQIRRAEKEDCKQIMRMIVEFAEHENMADHVKMTADTLREDGFGEDRIFECLVVEPTSSEEPGEAKNLIGYALFYVAFSSREGKFCCFDNLYIIPQWRNRGIGTALWVEVTKVALSNGCARLQWAVREQNSVAIELYKCRKGISITYKQGTYRFQMTRPVMENFVK